MSDDLLLSVDRLSVMLPSGGDRPFAVEDVSLVVRRNEIVCLVGESGSGKSITAHAVLGLLPPNLAVASGTIASMAPKLPPPTRPPCAACAAVQSP